MDNTAGAATEIKMGFLSTNLSNINTHIKLLARKPILSNRKIVPIIVAQMIAALNGADRTSASPSMSVSVAFGRNVITNADAAAIAVAIDRSSGTNPGPGAVAVPIGMVIAAAAKAAATIMIAKATIRFSSIAWDY